MRIAAISDTHGWEGWIIPPCDVFVHAGDLTGRGTVREAEVFANTLKRRLDRGDVGAAIIVPGNHDECFETYAPATLRWFDDPRIHVLINQGVEIGGKTFWGSPWTPPFLNWFFMAEEPRLRTMYERMPKTLDVLITHGPPYGYLDPGYQAEHVGSKSLLEAILYRSIKHHVFGHLHAAGGLSKSLAILDDQPDGGNRATALHNVAACDDAYRLANPAFEFEV